MKRTRNKSKRDPKVSNLIGIGIACLPLDDGTTVCSNNPEKPVQFIDLFDRTDKEICLRITQNVKLQEPFVLKIYNRNEQRLDSCRCTGKWIKQDKTNPDFLFLGCEYKMLNNSSIWGSRTRQDHEPSSEDFEFLKATRFLKSIDRIGLCPLLNTLSFQRVSAGEIIMKQGDKGNDCFILHRGTCSVYIEQDSKKYQIDRIKAGDVVGEMAILTGEVRSATVEAETDTELWRIGRDQFDDISAKYPAVRNFLTELVTERFTSRKKTAKREIGKYVVTDIIGKGGYAIVYGGLHRDLNMAVAVKMMKHDLAMDKVFLKNFRNEARLIAQFNHRNIVRIYDIEERFRTIFIIMEFLRGIPLDEMLSNTTKLSYSKGVDYLVQISSGLQYAHERGVVHQDIKPANIFIRENGQLKILDFGLACPIATENIDFLGSPYYMSPEQIEMESVDERSDIYSLGIMAYEMILGQRPYPEDDLVRLEELHVEEDIPDPGNFDPDIPEELRKFILKACSRDRKKRYRNMKEVLEQIQPLYEKYRVGKKHIHRNKRKMTALFIFSREEDQMELNKLLEDFTSKAKDLGITLKATDFPDI